MESPKCPRSQARGGPGSQHRTHTHEHLPCLGLWTRKLPEPRAPDAGAHGHHSRSEVRGYTSKVAPPSDPCPQLCSQQAGHQGPPRRSPHVGCRSRDGIPGGERQMAPLSPAPWRLRKVSSEQMSLISGPTAATFTRRELPHRACPNRTLLTQPQGAVLGAPGRAGL